ncbi:zinc finger C2HC domain-containing protein 1C [Spea bombifrons]|uniref:zinc finger C2HC domain-containing protein 1C n=1 Tax=Spea bombifrons TaxID=233779 RepID=UPI00234BB09E|nr:zinc finger C2HC domain-containing protein 1C [Spea bombifrons]
MAQLKMAPYLHKESTEAKFPTLRAELQPPKNLSRLEQLRNEYQERSLREKEHKLLGLTQHDTRALHFQRRNPSPLWPSEERTWASNWTVCKKSAGVDRAHPLKPILHRKSPSHTSQRSPSANTAAIQNPPAFPGPVRSKSGSSQPEKWSRLQKTESDLEAEIRRKEALLREKLRRTEEELRRIQREKEDAELEDRRMRETHEARRRAGKTERRKAAKDQPYWESRAESEDDNEERIRRTKERSSHRILIGSPPPSEGNDPRRRLKEQMAGGDDRRKVPNRPSPLSPPEGSYRISSRTQPFQTDGDHRSRSGHPEAEEIFSPPGRSRSGRPEAEEIFSPPGRSRSGHPEAEEIFSPPGRSRSGHPEAEEIFSPPGRSRSGRPEALEIFSPPGRSRSGRPEAEEIFSPPGRSRRGRPEAEEIFSPPGRSRSGRPEAEEIFSPPGGSDDPSGELVPCRMCGRRFLAPRLEKHAQVCEKMQNSKRKVFDSSKARAKGTELEQFLQTKGKAPSSTPPTRGSSWRQKHDSFMRTIRQAREVQQVIARGGKLSDLPPPPPEENPDYIACPHCSRRFAPRAAERHIPKCETIKSKPRPPPSRRR